MRKKGYNSAQQTNFMIYAFMHWFKNEINFYFSTVTRFILSITKQKKVTKCKEITNALPFIKVMI